MAEDEAPVESAPAPARPMSTITFVLIVAGLTALAAGLGFFGGLQILASAEQALRGKAEDAAGPAVLQHAAGANVKVMAPIVTNLSGGGSRFWIRLESSLVFQDEIPSDADTLAARITEDIVAFLRTTSIKQVEGASGFKYLREDLNDRVRVRSNGRVQELIIQGLIVE